jgi:hypothetical protein
MGKGVTLSKDEVIAFTRIINEFNEESQQYSNLEFRGDV